MKLDLNQLCYVCGEWQNGDFVLVLRPSIENHSTDLLLPSGSS